MSQMDTLVSTALRQWLRGSGPPAGLRAELLRRAAAIRGERWEDRRLPDHLQAWNLPKRNAPKVSLWHLQSVALAVSFPSGGVKLML